MPDPDISKRIQMVRSCCRHGWDAETQRRLTLPQTEEEAQYRKDLAADGHFHGDVACCGCEHGSIGCGQMNCLGWNPFRSFRICEDMAVKHGKRSKEVEELLSRQKTLAERGSCCDVIKCHKVWQCGSAWSKKRFPWGVSATSYK